MYLVTVVAPMVRWCYMYPIFHYFYMYSKAPLASLSLSGQVSSLLAFEAAERTEFVYRQSVGRDQESCCSSRLRFRRVYRRLLEQLTSTAPIASSVKEEFKQLNKSADVTPVAAGSCCGRCRLRVEARAVDGAKKCGKSKRYAYLHFALFLANLMPDSMFRVPFCFPRRVSILFKIKFWGAVFDVLFYSFNASDGTFNPWDLRSSWTWHLKLLLAVKNLVDMRKISMICSAPWNCSRLGVTPSPFGNSADLWRDWSVLASERFKWGRSNNMWDLIRRASVDPRASSASTISSLTLSLEPLPSPSI